MLEYSQFEGHGITKPKFFFLVENIKRIKERMVLLDLFCIPSRPMLESMPPDLYGKPVIRVTATPQELQLYKETFTVFVRKTSVKNPLDDFSIVEPADFYYVYGILRNPANDNEIILLLLSETGNEPVFQMHERFQITAGMIDNYTSLNPITTDVGKFIANQLLFADPFGDIIPYHNKAFDLGSIDDTVASLILEGKINKSMFLKYMNNGYWYGMDGTIATVTWTEKSLTTDPNIRKRKKELLEQYKDSKDPLMIAKIEKELIAMDKAYLKNDESEPFYKSVGGKAFDEQRKKMFIMNGNIVAFDKNSGKYEFVPESLSDGWNATNLDKAFNEVRRGSYGRGIETAKGGEQTKFVLRTFQETSIEEEDCGSKTGISILITNDNKSKFYGRWTTTGVLFDRNNADTFIGKVVTFRSPMHCKTKNGFCFKCAGELFRKLDMRSIGMNSVILTSSFTTIAMKSMHSSGIKVVGIQDISKFLKT